MADSTRDGGGVVLDWSALDAPVSASAVRQWREEARAAGHPWARGSSAAAGASVALLGVLAAVVALGGLGVVIPSAGALVTGSGVAAGLGVVAGLLAIGISVGVAVAAIRLARRGDRWVRWFRLAQFARAHDLRFEPSAPAPGYPGTLFTRPGSHTVADRLVPASGSGFDVGNLVSVQVQDRTVTVTETGYIAIPLARPMPHLYLAATANEGVAGATRPSLAGDQVLSLEGDFDRYFALSCPGGAEADALYVFTPDVMAACIDGGSAFDVEIVDRWLVAMSPARFRMDDPSTLERLLHFVDTVGVRIAGRARRYRADLPSDLSARTTATEVSRLRHRQSRTTGVVLGIILGPPVIAALAFVVWLVVRIVTA